MSQQAMIAALERVTKWRTVLAGWHLGTRVKSEPGVAAMRDLREAVIILRIEVNALTLCMMKKGLVNVNDFQRAVTEEAAMAERDFEQRFPGIRAFNDGIEIFDTATAYDTFKRLGFPP